MYIHIVNMASAYYLSPPPHELQQYLPLGQFKESNITKTKINHYPFEGYG